MNKYFIITVDTESDNQWDVYNSQTTHNAKYIPRFQEVCDEYGFKPVYLVDYSMANDDFLVKYLNRADVMEKSEVGMHLHAWDTPPYYEIKAKYDARPYLMEYPRDIAYSKIEALNKLLEDKFERKMYSHRAGRWAINEEYIKNLEKLGYEVDCSVTPGINWNKQKGANIGGSDYTKEKREIHFFCSSNILEIPMTVGTVYGTSIRRKDGFIRMGKDLIQSVMGKRIALRPALYKNDELLRLIDSLEQKNCGYLEFMVHSSELMPGGSPYFKTEEEIQALMKRLGELFSDIRKRGIIGATLKEVNDIYRKGMMD